MELDPQELDRLAHLARVPLDAAERETLMGELELILERFARLADEVNLDDAGPEEAAGVLRPDEIVEPVPAELAAILAAFPRRRGELLEVPRGLP